MTLGETCKCVRCGHEWLPRTKAPKCCPACKAYHWEREPSREGPPRKYKAPETGKKRKGSKGS